VAGELPRLQNQKAVILQGCNLFALAREIAALSCISWGACFTGACQLELSTVFRLFYFALLRLQ
jgi:hypothetical protein